MHHYHLMRKQRWYWSVKKLHKLSNKQTNKPMLGNISNMYLSLIGIFGTFFFQKLWCDLTEGLSFCFFWTLKSVPYNWRMLTSLHTWLWLTLSLLALSLWMMTLSRSGKRTCHKTACQVFASNMDPCAAMVENKVWPELFRTEGRESRQRSLSLQYRHIHNLSKEEMFLLPGNERKASGNICWSLVSFCS